MHRRFALLPLMFLFAGCSEEPTQSLSGIVRLDGKPTAGITITFFTSNNRTAIADTDKEGRYTVEVTGTGLVQVTAQVPPPRPKPRPDPPKNLKGDGMAAAKSDDAGKLARMPVGEPSETPPAIPLDSKYNDAKTSGLDFTLTGGKQTKDFDLTTSGKGN